MIRLLKTMLLVLAGFFAGRKATKQRPLPPPRPGWRHFFKRLVMLMPVLAVGGFLLAASGIIPIKASSGHWGITAWFLNFSKSRSVATHTMGMSAPPLEDPALVVKGAGHYEIGCRPCHGGVEVQPRIPGAATPHPPHLPPRISRWDPEELFYIVKHGIKFTGMPAWTTLERDDEVWAVVAFLLRLPDLDPAAYRRLVEGDVDSDPPDGAQNAPPADPRVDVQEDPPAEPQEADTAGVMIDELDVADMQAPAPEIVRRVCANCHGARGEGREVSAFPRLAGQRPEYLYAALRVYADGMRHSGIMEPIAAEMTDENMRATAIYFAQSGAAPRLAESVPPQSVSSSPQDGGPPVEAGGAPRSTVDQGREIALRGVPSRKVPSCADCHGPVDRPRNPYYPVLAGQYADYIALQLELFKERRRGGSAFAHIMHHAASRLTEEEIHAVAQFYESLGARR